jgi:DNA processing protein
MPNLKEFESLLGLNFCTGIGPVISKQIIRFFGDSETAVNEIKKGTRPIDGISSHHWKLLSKFPKALERAKQEIAFCEQKNIKIISYYSKDYPSRLKQLVDAPLLLFAVGNSNLNPSKALSIVGTRKPHSDSIKITEKLVEEITKSQPQIISGLAYGIDKAAHNSALKNQLSTVGVLAHGLNQIYPQAHKKLAKQMLENGGMLVTEMPSTTKLHPDLFPKRNRIIAGLSDAIVVIESKVIGGSMSTAQLGRSYDREVFAFPGNPVSGNRGGCNALIKRNVAQLVESSEDISRAMKWHNQPTKNKPISFSLFPNLNHQEQEILRILTGKNLHIDQLIESSSLPLHLLTLGLLELELKGLISTLPGKYYQRIA